MELSINISNLMGRYDFAKCIDIYKEAGFTACDYSLMGLVNDGDRWNGDNYRELAEEVRRIADEKGFPITQTHAPFTFKAAQWDDPTVYEEIVFPRMVRTLEISGMIGAKTVVVHPIHHMVYHGHEEEIFERNMAYYRSLIPYAKEYGVKVAVENMFQADPRRKCIVADTCSNLQEFIRYVDTLDSEQITACLDVGHVGLPLTDVEAPEFIRGLGHDRLGALHIHDNDYRNDQHVLPYLGTINWMEVAKALGEIDYQGDFTYEVKGNLVCNCDEGFLPTMAAFYAAPGKHICAEIDRNRPQKG
ncbi:MAG: sugar phosphate isomerase/epimerase [Ruminococcaceae bacterium]|nr:sugar phosphate isomerase/epimerase [Oscillospiraceae bacterium]